MRSISCEHRSRPLTRARSDETDGMTSDHFDRTLRAFQWRTPFTPFIVELLSGDRFQVDHPEALVLRGGVATTLVVTPEEMVPQEG